MKDIQITIKMDEESCKLLSEQKQTLVKSINDGKLNDDMYGIVHVIDSIQDQLVDNNHFPEEIVFPNEKKEE